jgi:single-strand DNA-binding protein
MTEAAVSFAGNLTDDPEVRYTESGIARAVFRVAVSGRREQEASFFTVIVWRDQAEHAAESLSKGSRVVVVGRLQQRTWTAEDGSARSTVEMVAEELGPSLRWATATPARPSRAAAGSISCDHSTSADQGDPKVLGPPLLLVSSCFPHSRHSRYQPPWGLRRRCQRWIRSLQRQGFAMAASLGLSRAGSLRATRRVQTRDRTPVAWCSCSEGVMPYSSARNSWRYR